MTATLESPGRSPLDERPPLHSGRVSRALHIGVGVAAIAIGASVAAALGAFRWGWILVLAAVAYAAAIYVVSRIVEDPRQAKNRLATAVVTIAFVLVMLPLVSVVWTVVREGAARFDARFFTSTMRLTPEEMTAQADGAEVGGAFHAIVGTLVVTSIAAIIAVPLGLFTAIYLVEYGRGRLARAITAMVDVMTGIPSIVAGLFAYALFVLIFGPGTRTGLAGGVALSVLMTPVVIRSAEEMLKLVPNELREAAFALGVPKWKMVVKIVLPTAAAGILTGITLAVARVIGETAPLLVTVGLAQDTNFNPFDGRMTTLPVYTYYQYVQPGLPPAAGQDRAWAAALTLVVIVAVLFTAARIIARVLKPKGLQ